MDVVRKGYSVIKRISLLVTAALMAAMMMVATAAPAFAAQLSTEEQCALEGGTYTPNPPGPEKASCVTEEPANPPGRGLTAEEETTFHSEGGGGGTIAQNEEDTSVKNKAGHEPAGQNK